VPFDMLWIALLMPLVLMGTVLRPKSAAGRFLEWGPLRWVGRLSYSLYIWQQLFLVPRPALMPFGVIHAFPLDWCAVFACAIASHYLIEQPCIRWGRLWASSRQRKAGAKDAMPSRLAADSSNAMQQS
jgi:peptidoglycan/LPS O-acetylase OafA/YrhL